MSNDFDPKPLCAAYDRGRLVPFIGSGMSIPTCTSWENFVENLEKQCGIKASELGLIQRASRAMQRLRVREPNVATAIEKAVYSGNGREVPRQTEALAARPLSWPLVCTTNYDDLYLRARFRPYRAAIQVAGRSDADCRLVLQHLNFPIGEMVWALQGFLSPDDALRGTYPIDHLKKELVVGHAEYRQTAHREVHFRRCFAEVFRKVSLFFLGSGLAEPYFLTLFDEIIELTGPPAQPHFAIVEEGQVDPELMRQQYHIVCTTYPKGQHQCVAVYLKEFSKFVEKCRVRPSAWGFRMRSPQLLGQHDSDAHFTIVRGVLPDPRSLPAGEAVAISCGRGETEKPTGGGTFAHGQVLVNPGIAVQVGLPNGDGENYDWLNYWTVQWKDPQKAPKNVYGIVARKLIDGHAQDLRSPDAIQKAFLESLEAIANDGIGALHVQLLASGQRRAFHPWVALTQTIRAYGQWFRGSQNPALSVRLYVVDPVLIALLHGSFINVAEHLEDTPLHIGVEVIDALGGVSWSHQLVKADTKLADLVIKGGTVLPQLRPRFSARPMPSKGFEPMKLTDNDKDLTIQEFGLVSGSTLILDYR